MNNFTSPFRLEDINNLLQRRAATARNLINSLKYHDVSDDTTFTKTSQRIKEQVLLIPVKIEAPKLLDHNYQERELTIEQQFIGGVSRNIYSHTISYPFTGDRNLFSYTSGGLSFSTSDHGVIQPQGAAIIVNIDLPELDPQLAMDKANGLLGLTFRLIERNNALAKEWSNGISIEIDASLEQKKGELIRLFGPQS